MKESSVFLKPDYIYVPFNDRTLLNIKLNMYVYNNQKLGTLKNGNFIYSTCSGKLVNLETIETVDGKMNSMVIENDFREKRKKRIGMKRNLLTLEKEDMLKRLDKYSLNIFNGFENLIILVEYTRGVDNSDSYTLKDNIDEVLETIDALNTILELKSTIIVSYSHDTLSTNIIRDYIGTYPNIGFTTTSREIKDNDYSSLIKKVYKKEKALVITLDKLYEIFYALKKNRTLNSKVITIHYKKNVYNVNVKINTKVKELLNYLKINSNKVLLKKEKLVEVNINNAVITKDLKAIVVE